MSIPAWRKVEYTDDGCSIYECLSCYNQWEARSNPEYSEWKFCPYCAIMWEKEVKDPKDLVYHRRESKSNPRRPYIELESKHYQLDDEGCYQCLLDWEYVSYGYRFLNLPPNSESDYGDIPDHYKDFLYRIRVANLIKDLAKDYSDLNSVCENFFMFSEGYELRIRIEENGENRFIMLTDGIEPVVRKYPYTYGNTFSKISKVSKVSKV